LLQLMCCFIAKIVVNCSIKGMEMVVIKAAYVV
jgi:hypothetical protein